MSLTRHLNLEGVAHANADSRVHERHVRQRAAKRSVEWIPEIAPENSALEFRLRDGLDLGKGAYFKGSGKEDHCVSGPKFESHCSSVNWDRRWYFASMKRGEKTCQVRRKRTSPACEEFVVNFAPFQMRFINLELERWEQAGISTEKRTEMLSAMVNDLRSGVVQEFSKVTGRDVVASYVHFDSNKIHVGVVHSRIGPDNHLVGVKRLGTAGPWSVGQNRLSKLGLVDAGDHRLAENLERFHARYGKDNVPLDIRLHDLLDEKFSAMVGKIDDDAGGRYEAAKKYYKIWKLKTRREAPLRSSSSQRVAWETVKLFTPLLPPQVKSALAVARTAVQVFQILGVALDAISPPQPSQNRQREIEKTL